MLILYLVRYRASSCRSRTHGNLAQVKQNPPPFAASSSQFLMRQGAQCCGFLVSSPLHPSHRFFSLRQAMQRPQFIPQGAISSAHSDSGSIVPLPG